MRDLDTWLFQLAGFQRVYKQLCYESVAQQFPLLRNSISFTESEINYLLTCGSIFGHSNNSKCQDAALRISQFILTSDLYKSKADSAALILDSLANNPTIRLAEKREYLALDYRNRLPLSAYLETVKRDVENSINLSNDSVIQVNKFQSRFWNLIENNKRMSVSAPTSAGKSFILETWIQDLIFNKDDQFVVYLVPTRALISQVEKDLKERLDPKNLGYVNVASLPMNRAYKAGVSNVFVFTQERLHIFLNSFTDPPLIDVLIVDEAHKIGDDHRGVFLQQVIEHVSLLNPDIKVVFASPFTDNPELLLENFPKEESEAFKSSDVTVNQNLIWVRQLPQTPKKWEIDLCLPEEIIKIGQLNLQHNPTHVSKRLPFVAFALSNNLPGNIVYVNNAASAEKAASQLFDLLEDIEGDEEIKELIELCEKTIHKKYKLNTTLKRGVAFHYGNMPLLVKAEIERLFSKNKIKFLVCTSTLVEGVNMSCRNIFVRGPKKGPRTPMNAEDFWNLAGRAGRWGREFQGNVICVDSDRADLWLNGNPPRTKLGIRIARSTDKIIDNLDVLIDYIQSPNHLKLSNENPDLEHVFSYLCITFLRYGSLNDSPYLSRKPNSTLKRLTEVIDDVLSNIDYSKKIIEKNPGISPISMQMLLERFARPSPDPVERLLLAEPSSQDALSNYTAAFSRISATVSNKLGFSSKQAAVRALLVVRWMRGYPLARLIQDRIEYLKKKKDKQTETTTIRDVMKDVEETARYQAPRLLSCYNDILIWYYQSIEREDLVQNIQDLSIYLEMGLNQQTQLSLVEMGMSRTSAVLLSELITDDKFTVEDCVKWLSENEWQLGDMPALVIREIKEVHDGYLARQTPQIDNLDG